MILKTEIETSLWEHIHELRGTIFQFLLILLIGFLVALSFYPSIMSLITPNTHSSPLILEKVERNQIRNRDNQSHSYFFPPGVKVIFTSETVFQLKDQGYEIPPGGVIEYEKRVQEPQLVILDPLEGILTTFKVCFWVALAGTAPFWGWTLLRFISPGLQDHEKKSLVPFLVGSLLFIALGFLLAYKVTIPLANAYFSLFNTEIGINLWSLSHYVNYSLMLMLGHAVAFELCFLLLFLVHTGWISAEWLMAKRRIMILLAFVLGALLTPPDVLTQLMLAIPLIIIYEITLLYAKRIGRMR